MGRCAIGEKKVSKYRNKTGLPVLAALTRGGTNHRIDLLLDDGSVMHWYKNGGFEVCSIKWNIEGWRERHLPMVV